MTTEPRVLRAHEWDTWSDRLVAAFGGVESREERELIRELTEVDRSLAVWDGGAVVGSASASSFRVTVPGGSAVPAAGVTMVHVTATHRRRGILRSMMRRQLDDVREAGAEPLAVLTASEPEIYGRFGYGLATRQMGVEIDTSRTRFEVPDGDAVNLRVVDDPSSVLERCEAVYARRVPGRPGMLARQPGWERWPLLDPEQEREGASPLRCVLAERDGETVGYARYAMKDASDTWGVPCGEVLLRDLEALDPVAYAELWRYLGGVDLTTVLRSPNRPVDDPLAHLVSDVRKCRMRVRDGMFLRPVEVGAALAARTYAVPVDMVLDVEDAFCPWNAGRWRLSGDAKGAVCERTTGRPDLALSVRELGAAYLGGESLLSLAMAGRVRELRGGAVAEASAAFAGAVAPWLPHGF
ncbi:GNAT family N-acetyltransferase [Streptomyces sp. ODS28]|uniref:GNAT family N-acetyltransferase n=1 Tax=Streptomyces sp. ODS28 TaxID=3136688 RepID=UPI0031EE28D8